MSGRRRLISRTACLEDSTLTLGKGLNYIGHFFEAVCQAIKNYQLWKPFSHLASQRCLSGTNLQCCCWFRLYCSRSSIRREFLDSEFWIAVSCSGFMEEIFPPVRCEARVVLWAEAIAR